MNPSGLPRSDPARSKPTMSRSSSSRPCRMLSGSSDLARSSLRISHEGEFYRRLLSREAISAAVPSFRACDGTSCAVPFMWESRPGTPKHPICPDAALPPLTPPPSYKCSPRRSGSAAEKHSFKGVLGAVLPRLTRRKPRAPPPMQDSTASPFSSVCSCGHHGHGRLPGCPLSSMEDEGDSEIGLHASTPCFGLRNGGRGGCYSAVIQKKSFHLPWM